MDDGVADPTEVATNPDDLPDAVEYEFTSEINHAISNFCTSHVYAPETNVFNVSQSTFANATDISKMRPDFSWSYPGHKTIDFLYGLSEGEVYRVDAETSNLTPQDMFANGELIKEADLKEIKSFLTHDVWRLVPAAEHKSTRSIDCTWIRQWKFPLIQVNDREWLSLACALEDFLILRRAMFTNLLRLRLA